MGKLSLLDIRNLNFIIILAQKSTIPAQSQAIMKNKKHLQSC